MPSLVESTQATGVERREMLAARFFARLGMFVVDEFLDAASCSRLCAEMRASARMPATVGQGGKEAVDSDVRAAEWAAVSRESKHWMRERLRSLKTRVEEHFAMKLADCQPPQFLVYRSGDFYTTHSDNAPNADSPGYVRERLVSLVLFLNGRSSTEDDATYDGGALTFAGLIDDPRLSPYAYPLAADRGQLVAFRSNVLHAVAPVVRGERYTVVSWFV
jgi:SM-20-related protein